MGGCRISRKKRYVTLEWPPKKRDENVEIIDIGVIRVLHNAKGGVYGSTHINFEGLQSNVISVMIVHSTYKYNVC